MMMEPFQPLDGRGTANTRNSLSTKSNGLLVKDGELAESPTLKVKSESFVTYNCNLCSYSGAHLNQAEIFRSRN